jgi:hypothetical protein
MNWIPKIQTGRGKKKKKKAENTGKEDVAHNPIAGNLLPPPSIFWQRLN